MRMIWRKTIGRLRFSVFPTAHDKEVKRWRCDHGEDKRYDYPLDCNSFVMDLGGYKGQWASDIYSRYRCRIVIFEPVTEFAGRIQNRFLQNTDIRVFPFGLGGVSRIESISVCEDGSSIFRKSPNRQEIQIVDIAEWIKTQDISQIDLMKVNVEGTEYELIERLIDTDLARLVKNIQVQFHQVGRDSTARMDLIHRGLRETHHPSYLYRFVWENWVRHGC